MVVAKRMSFEGGIINLDDMAINTITPEAAKDLVLQGVTGKDILVNLTDAAGARKLKVIDSGTSEVFSIDSNGLATAAGGFAGALTGNVTGNLTGNVTGNLTGNVTGNITGDSTGTHTGDVVNANDAAIDFASGHADYTLSSSEKKAKVLVAKAADAGANIIAPAEKRTYILRNESGQTITIKKSAGTGVAVANGKTAEVYYSTDEADYVRLTADATH